MTVSTVFSKQIYACNGATTAFSFPYRVIDATHLVVKKVTISTGAETTLTKDVDYTVSSVPADSVTVTTGSAYSSLFKVSIDMEPTFNQDVDFTKFGKFPAETIERALDKSALQAQSTKAKIARSIQIDPTLVDFTGTNKITQSAAERASKVVGFSDDGNDVELYENPGAAAVTASAAATAAAASETAAAASATSAAASATSAAASLDSFDDRYLGAKTSDPTLDNDGNALLTGALYWNTTSSNLRVYNGSSWSIYNGVTVGGYSNEGYRSRYYYYSEAVGYSASSFTATKNQLYAIPFYVHKDGATFDRIGVVFGATGSGNARLGIYNVANGVPTSLVADLGTIAYSAGAEVYLTINQALNMKLYALAVVFSATPDVNRCSSLSVAAPVFNGNVDLTTGSHPGWYCSHTYGALPSTFGATTNTTAATQPFILVRAA